MILTFKDADITIHRQLSSLVANHLPNQYIDFIDMLKHFVWLHVCNIYVVITIWKLDMIRLTHLNAIAYGGNRDLDFQQHN